MNRRRADRYFDQWGPRLCESIDGLPIDGYPEHRVHCKYATEHRCGVVISGPGLSDRITGTDPLRDALPLRKCQAITAEAELTARIVNALHRQVYRILSQHPVTEERKRLGLPIANCLLFRGCGQRLAVMKPGSSAVDELANFTNTRPPLHSFHLAESSFAIAPTCMIAGWMRTLGVDTWRMRVDGYSADRDAECVINAEAFSRVTGDCRSDLLVKADTAVNNLSFIKNRNCEGADNPVAASSGGDGWRYHLGFVHCKGMDDAGHDGNIEERVEMCQRSDEMLGYIVKRLIGARFSNNSALDVDNLRGTDVVIVITGDHSTPVNCGDHSTDPVPFTITCLSALARLLRGSNASPLDRIKEITQTNASAAIVETEFTDSVTRFGESCCATGRLGRFVGLDVMPFIDAYCRGLHA